MLLAALPYSPGCTPPQPRAETGCCCCAVVVMRRAPPWGMHMGLPGTGTGGGSGMQHQVPCPQGGISTELSLWATGCTSQAVLWAEAEWWVWPAHIHITHTNLHAHVHACASGCMPPRATARHCPSCLHTPAHAWGTVCKGVMDHACEHTLACRACCFVMLERLALYTHS